jgi:peptide methionine sulfoxide reductase msrA/msrB
MELRKYLSKRSIFAILIILGAVTGVLFQQKIVSGAAWMTGTQELELEDSRFTEEANESSKFWVQESYKEEIENLSAREYHVTQKNGTEPPFRNELYDEKRSGIYVDVVSGAPLFSSKHKFDSGTGWPSFYKPLEPDNIIERKDPGPLGVRVEIASKHAKTHLGHLFRNPDTPTGLRYCMNSASLEFVPANKLEERGYDQYVSMFKQKE